MDEVEERCSTCRFWEGFGGASHEGVCQRYPPAVGPELLLHLLLHKRLPTATESGNMVEWANPVTPGHTFCGEWQEAK